MQFHGIDTQILMMSNSPSDNSRLSQSFYASQGYSRHNLGNPGPSHLNSTVPSASVANGLPMRFDRNDGFQYGAFDNAEMTTLKNTPFALRTPSADPMTTSFTTLAVQDDNNDANLWHKESGAADYDENASQPWQDGLPSSPFNTWPGRPGAPAYWPYHNAQEEITPSPDFLHEEDPCGPSSSSSDDSDKCLSPPSLAGESVPFAPSEAYRIQGAPNSESLASARSTASDESLPSESILGPRPDTPPTVCDKSTQSGRGRTLLPASRKEKVAKEEMNQPTNLRQRRGDCAVKATVPSADRNEQDVFLLRSKTAGKSYKQIRKEGGFKVTESTLRGRYRMLTKASWERVRKPQWQEHDVSGATGRLSLDVNISGRTHSFGKLWTFSRSVRS